jgi:hypothetical protein
MEKHNHHNHHQSHKTPGSPAHYQRTTKNRIPPHLPQRSLCVLHRKLEHIIGLRIHGHTRAAPRPHVSSRQCARAPALPRGRTISTGSFTFAPHMFRHSASPPAAAGFASPSRVARHVKVSGAHPQQQQTKNQKHYCLVHS